MIDISRSCGFAFTFPFIHHKVVKTECTFGRRTWHPWDSKNDNEDTREYNIIETAVCHTLSAQATVTELAMLAHMNAYSYTAEGTVRMFLSFLEEVLYTICHAVRGRSCRILAVVLTNPQTAYLWCFGNANSWVICVPFSVLAKSVLSTLRCCFVTNQNRGPQVRNGHHL